jgi:aspartate ammonia-lyase
LVASLPRSAQNDTHWCALFACSCSPDKEGNQRDVSPPANIFLIEDEIMSSVTQLQTRTEKDSLGPKEIPAHVYYGIQTARAVENFPISGLRAHPSLIRAIAMVKEAAALANRELGLVDEKTANAIIEAAKEVQQGKWDQEFVVDVFQAGAGVSFHMNSNEVIANRASELLGGKLGEYKHVHPNDHVNYGQSTNDVFPTAMRLAALLELEKLYAVASRVDARPLISGGLFLAETPNLHAPAL